YRVGEPTGDPLNHQSFRVEDDVGRVTLLVPIRKIEILQDSSFAASARSKHMRVLKPHPLRNRLFSQHFLFGVFFSLTLCIFLPLFAQAFVLLGLFFFCFFLSSSVELFLFSPYAIIDDLLGAGELFLHALLPTCFPRSLMWAVFVNLVECLEKYLLHG